MAKKLSKCYQLVYRTGHVEIGNHRRLISLPARHLFCNTVSEDKTLHCKYPVSWIWELKNNLLTFFFLISWFWLITCMKAKSMMVKSCYFRIAVRHSVLWSEQGSCCEGVFTSLRWSTPSSRAGHAATTKHRQADNWKAYPGIKIAHKIQNGKLNCP